MASEINSKVAEIQLMATFRNTGQIRKGRRSVKFERKKELLPPWHSIHDFSSQWSDQLQIGMEFKFCYLQHPYCFITSACS